MSDISQAPHQYMTLLLLAVTQAWCVVSDISQAPHQHMTLLLLADTTQAWYVVSDISQSSHTIGCKATYIYSY